MDFDHKSLSPSDALVLFGISGDLAYKKIFPALYDMARHGVLNVPIIGVASTDWTVTQLRDRACDSLTRAGKVDDDRALSDLLSRLGYVNGDYNDPATFVRLKQALGDAKCPTFYLAIPPALDTCNIPGGHF